MHRLEKGWQKNLHAVCPSHSSSHLCMGYEMHVFCSYLSRDWSKCKYRLLSLFKLIVEGIQERRQKTDGESTCTGDKVFIVLTLHELYVVSLQ